MRRLLPLLLPLVLVLVAAACAEDVDPQLVAACDEVRELQAAVVRLGYAQVEEPEELGEYVGEIFNHAREVERLAEDAGHERLHTLARDFVRSVLPGVSLSAAMGDDPRAAASPAARVTIEMRDECREAGVRD